MIIILSPHLGIMALVWWNWLCLFSTHTATNLRNSNWLTLLVLLLEFIGLCRKTLSHYLQAITYGVYRLRICKQ